MPSLTHLASLPANFELFAAEVASGLGALYGPLAADEYRAEAAERFQSALEHPQVTGLAIKSGGDVVGIALLIDHLQRLMLNFVHILAAHAGPDSEERLIGGAMDYALRRRPDAILAECVPFFPYEGHTVFQKRGFSAIERLLMEMDLCGTREFIPHSMPLLPEEIDAAARILVAAYEDHPDRSLHRELQSDAGARQYVQAVLNGAYGSTDAGFNRILRVDGEPAGVLLGCRVAPGVGFIVQVVVRPEFQGQGMGMQLVNDACGAFEQAAFDRVALGVTAASPARRLYERLGFTARRSINAYLWPPPVTQAGIS